MMQPNMTLRRLLWRIVKIEDDFIDGINNEVTEQVDYAAKHDIKKAVVDIFWDTEKAIQLSGLR